MNCSSDLKKIANSWLSASNLESFSQSSEQIFLTVAQNNFGNKKNIAELNYWFFSILKDAPGEEKDKDKESKDDEKSAEKKDSTDEAMDTSKAPEVKKENGTDENKSSPRDRLIKDSKLQAAAASGIYFIYFMYQLIFNFFFKLDVFKRIC